MTHHADNLFIVTGGPGAGKTTLLKAAAKRIGQEAARGIIPSHAQRVDASLRDVYAELGYRIVELPKAPVAERLAFVKDIIAHA